MKARIPFVLSALALSLVACSSTQTGEAPNTLVAARVSTAPALDGIGTDPAWAGAKPLTFAVSGGENFGGKGGTTVTMKSVVAGDMIYFLIEYADPTQSMRRQPFIKQADGSWIRAKDPNDKGGDDNIYYEDKWSIIWNTAANPVKGFDQNGCAVMCHLGQGKPFGNKYNSAEGEIADMWHMKGARTGVVGFVDDQYVDATRYDPAKSPNAGRKGDPGGPDYQAYSLKDGKPPFMNKDGKAANAGGTYWIKDGEQVAFVDNFKPGDEVASYVVFPLKGDRSDVKTAYRYANGKWTFEVARKLVTGSKFDVQFDDMNKAYPFGFAAFDNAQVRHAVNFDVLKLVIAK